MKEAPCLAVWKRSTTLLVGGLVVAIAACQMGEQRSKPSVVSAVRTNPQLSGKLLFGLNGYLQSFDLKTLQMERAWSKEIVPPQLSKLDESHLVVATVGGQLSVLDLVTKAEHRMGTGSNPLYVPAHDRLLFTGRGPDGKTPQLLMSPLNEGLSPRKSLSEELYPVGLRMFLISPDQLVFRDREALRLSMVYDFRSEKATSLPWSDGYIPIAARTATGEILCIKRGEGGAYLVDLDGNVREPLPMLDTRRFYAVLYIEALDVLVFGRSANKLPP